MRRQARVSRLALRLQAQGMRVLGVDFDPEVVKEQQGSGLDARFGDCEAPDFIESLPFHQAADFAALDIAARIACAEVNQTTLAKQHRQRIKREALDRLDELAHDAGLTPAQWQPLVAFANPPDYVLEQEEEQGADLIVLVVR